MAASTSQEGAAAQPPGVSLSVTMLCSVAGRVPRRPAMGAAGRQDPDGRAGPAVALRPSQGLTRPAGAAAAVPTRGAPRAQPTVRPAVRPRGAAASSGLMCPVCGRRCPRSACFGRGPWRCLWAGDRAAPKGSSAFSDFHRGNPKSPPRLTDHLVRKKTSPQSHTRLQSATRTGIVTPRGPRPLPAAPSRTRGSYWTWDLALLAPPPRTTRLQVGGAGAPGP